MKWLRKVRDFLNGDSIGANVIGFLAGAATRGLIGRNGEQVKESLMRRNMANEQNEFDF